MIDPILQLLGIGALGLVTAIAITGFALHYAHRNKIIDVPNHRSSHSTPTPRGGGIAIVAVTLVALVALVWQGGLPPRFGAALIAASALIAATGAWDDVQGVSVRTRLAIQLAAAIVLAWNVLPAAPSISSLPSPLPWAIAIVIIVAVVWMTNLYNFMDGIDGIAGLQAVIAGLTAVAIFRIIEWPGAAHAAAAIAGASLDFLVFNWTPARIFMGDIGSAFLGFIFAALALAGLQHSPIVGIALLLPLLPFVIDTTVTLLFRLARGAPSAAAHREHVYQLAIRAGYRHPTVTLAVGGLSAILGGVAIAATRNNQMFIPAVATVSTIFLHLALRTWFRKKIPA